MKTEELQALGLSEEQIKGVFAINGKDIAKANKSVSDLEAERDDLKNRLSTAETTLKGFEGIDPQKMNEQIESYKRQAEEAEKNFKNQITQRDQRDWINSQMEALGVSSPYARKQLENEVMTGLTWKDGEFLGFNDYMSKAKEKDPSLYLTKEEKEAIKKAPSFTSPQNNGSGGNTKREPIKFF